jgi:hypothetical protein
MMNIQGAPRNAADGAVGTTNSQWPRAAVIGGSWGADLSREDTED